MGPQGLRQLLRRPYSNNDKRVCVCFFLPLFIVLAYPFPYPFRPSFYWTFIKVFLFFTFFYFPYLPPFPIFIFFILSHLPSTYSFPLLFFSLSLPPDSLCFPFLFQSFDYLSLCQVIIYQSRRGERWTTSRVLVYAQGILLPSPLYPGQREGGESETSLPPTPPPPSSNC